MRQSFLEALHAAHTRAKAKCPVGSPLIELPLDDIRLSVETEQAFMSYEAFIALTKKLVSET